MRARVDSGACVVVDGQRQSQYDRILDGSLCFSSDSKRVAYLAERDGMQMAVIDGREDGRHRSVKSLVFSPNGQRLASASEDHTVKLWDAKTGQEALTLKGHTNGVTSVTFSPNGDLFTYITSAGTGGLIKIFDVPSWQLAKLVTDDVASALPFPWFFASAFSPDGRWLAVSTAQDVIFYNTKDWSIRNRVGYRWVNSISFSPNGRMLATGEDRFDIDRNGVTLIRA